jgi:hypothetical protein
MWSRRITGVRNFRQALASPHPVHLNDSARLYYLFRRSKDLRYERG